MQVHVDWGLQSNFFSIFEKCWATRGIGTVCSAVMGTQHHAGLRHLSLVEVLAEIPHGDPPCWAGPTVLLNWLKTNTSDCIHRIVWWLCVAWKELWLAAIPPNQLSLSVSVSVSPQAKDQLIVWGQWLYSIGSSEARLICKFGSSIIHLMEKYWRRHVFYRPPEDGRSFCLQRGLVWRTDWIFWR